VYTKKQRAVAKNPSHELSHELDEAGSDHALLIILAG
jgi:hypothetical protein